MTAPQPPYGGPPPEYGHHPQPGAFQYPPPTSGHYPAPYTGGYPQPSYGPPPTPRRPRSKLPWILGGIVALVVVIGAVAPRGGSAPKVTVAAPAPVATAPADAPAAADAGSGVPTWGQRATTDAGLGIEVAKPEAYKASRSAAGNDRGRAVKVTTTVVNGTSEPYELNTFIIGPTATHASQSAPEIYDFGGDIDVVPVTTILPGKSFTYSTLLSIGKDEAEMQLEYSPELFEDPVIFVGNV
jgi:hypothetical protein